VLGVAGLRIHRVSSVSPEHATNVHESPRFMLHYTPCLIPTIPPSPAISAVDSARTPPVADAMTLR